MLESQILYKMLDIIKLCGDVSISKTYQEVNVGASI